MARNLLVAFAFGVAVIAAFLQKGKWKNRNLPFAVARFG